MYRNHQGLHKVLNEIICWDQQSSKSITGCQTTCNQTLSKFDCCWQWSNLNVKLRTTAKVCRATSPSDFSKYVLLHERILNPHGYIIHSAKSLTSVSNCGWKPTTSSNVFVVQFQFSTMTETYLYYCQQLFNQCSIRPFHFKYQQAVKVVPKPLEMHKTLKIWKHLLTSANDLYN